MNNIADDSRGSYAFAQHSELYAAGIKAFRNGNFSAARKSLQIATEYCPDDGDTWHALANCHVAMGKTGKAGECFRKALLYADEDSIADIYFDFGNCLYDQAKFAEALHYYLLVPEGAADWHQTARNIVLTRQMASPEKTGN